MERPPYDGNADVELELRQAQLGTLRFVHNVFLSAAGISCYALLRDCFSCIELGISPQSSSVFCVGQGSLISSMLGVAWMYELISKKRDEIGKALDTARANEHYVLHGELPSWAEDVSLLGIDRFDLGWGQGGKYLRQYREVKTLQRTLETFIGKETVIQPRNPHAPQVVKQQQFFQREKGPERYETIPRGRAQYAY